MRIINSAINAHPAVQFLFLVAVKILIVLIAIPTLNELFPGAWQTGTWPDGYDKLAMNVLQGNGYRFYPETSETLLRTPGFVLILAMVFSIFGKSLAAVQILNVICSTLAAFVVASLTFRVTRSRKMAIVAALITLFYPGVIVAEGRGGLECIYMLAVTLTVILLYKALATQRLAAFAYFGLALGVSLLIRSTLLLAPIAVLFYLLFDRKTRGKIGPPLKWIAVSTLAALVVLMPWIARNYALTSEVVPTMTVKGVAAFQGLYVNQHLDSTKAYHELLQEAAEEQNEIARTLGLAFKPGFFQYFYDPKDELKFYGHLSEMATSECLAAPHLLLKGLAANFTRFWFQGRTKEATLMNVAVALPFLVLALVGSVIALARGYQITPLILMVAAYIAPHALLLGLARYHIPIVPLLAVPASVAIILVASRWHLRGNRQDCAKNT